MACHGAPAVSPSSTEGGGASPIGDFCRDHPCTYDAYRAHVAGSPRCPHAEAGTCGDLRYVELDAVDGMERAYFGRYGAVGAVKASDTGDSQSFGAVPTCDRVTTETLCGR